MRNMLRILFVEDSENDVELIIRHLQLAGYIVDYERVEAFDEMKAALNAHSWDIILSDYNMPQFGAEGALSLCQEMELDIPFIVLSNSMSEETAVALMKAGAHDYLIKDHLVRLIPVVTRELNAAKIRTDKKLAFHALAQTEKRYRSLFEHSVWELHFDSGIVVASEGAQKLYGLDGGQFRYEDVKAIPLPEYRAMIDRAVFQLVDFGVPYDIEYKIKHCKTGQIIDIKSIAEYDSQERILFGVIQDITDRKKTEDALQKSERNLSNLISNLPGFVYRCKNDNNWSMEYLSEGFSAVTGYSIDDILEFKKITYNDIIHPDYRDYLWTQWQFLLKTNTPLEEEYPIITKSGEIRWVWERGKGIYDDHGDLICLEGFISDITERKRAGQIQKVLYDISTAVLTSENLEGLIEIIRNQLGKLLDTSNFYVAFYNEDTGLLHTSHVVDQKGALAMWPAEKSLTGYLIKQKKALLIAEEESLRLVNSGEIDLIGTVAKLWLGVPLYQDEKIIGALVVQSYDNPNAYNAKDVEMFEFISHQISLFVQRKRAEEEIKSALVKAEESDRLKSAFLATMNHELRTPLNHILGFSELILSGVMPEDNQSFASSIHSSGKNLLSIIEDVFDLALAEHANVKLKLQTFRLMDQFMENKSSFDQILQSSGKADQIQLIFKPDTRLLSMYMTLDRSKVNQILINLFKNAVKFTNNGTIEFGYRINKPGRLTFFIKDTGIGIAKEKQSVIFEFFRQGDDSPTRLYGGVGIGLAIALKITRILRGELFVESEPDSGSTFYLTVPVELAQVSDPL